MKKSTKGGIAASAAVLLLLGGLGTHSTWSANGSITGSQLKTGGISLTSPCDTDKSWTFGVGTVGSVLTSSSTVTHDNLASLLLVPGDLLTKTCTYTVSIKGDHLANATLSITKPTAVVDSGNNVLNALTVTSSFKDSNGDPIDTGATLANGSTIEATINVALDSGLLTGQNLTGTLDDITVTATQS